MSQMEIHVVSRTEDVWTELLGILALYNDLIQG